MLRPYLVQSGHDSFDLHFNDGDAAIYGVEDVASGFMVNEVSGRQAWDVLVEVARRGELAILAVGCPAAVTSEDLIADLPDALRADGRVVQSGDDLIRLIESS